MQGTLRVHLERAKGLEAKDWMSGKSDPFVVIHAGGQKRQSKTVKATLNPEFNEFLEFEVWFKGDGM